MEKRTLWVWIFVLVCIVGGVLSTRKGEEIKADYRREYAEIEKDMLANAADNGTLDSEKKHLFLSYLGFPNVNPGNLELRPVNANVLNYKFNIVADGKVIGETDRQTLEGYFVGRERPVLNDQN